jgi:hypothetical protein
MAQVVENLPEKWEAQSSYPRITSPIPNKKKELALVQCLRPWVQSPGVFKKRKKSGGADPLEHTLAFFFFFPKNGTDDSVCGHNRTKLGTWVPDR